MWRLSVGPGWLWAGQAAEGDDLGISGPGFSVEAALGGSLAPNLVLHGELLLARTGAASYRIGDREVVDGATFNAVCFGAGVTYWITPVDIYLTGAIGLSRLSLESRRIRAAGVSVPGIEESDLGFGVRAAVGKQWRLHGRWGLGAALQLLFLTASHDLDARGANLNTFGLAVLLTSTLG